MPLCIWRVDCKQGKKRTNITYFFPERKIYENVRWKSSELCVWWMVTSSVHAAPWHSLSKRNATSVTTSSQCLGQKQYSLNRLAVTMVIVQKKSAMAVMYYKWIATVCLWSRSSRFFVDYYYRMDCVDSVVVWVIVGLLSNRLSKKCIK